jgi:uncharacterized protein (TIGR02145 family)
MKKPLILLFLIIFSVSNSFAQTVTIGTQTWTTKNLDVSTFRNGDLIPEAKTDEEWKAANENKQPAWCYHENNTANGTKYGKLYNWYAVIDARGLAPAGWHVPTDEEWTVLENSLGDDAGKKMKSSSGWNSYKTRGSKTCPNCANWNAEYRKKVPCHTCKDTRSVGAPEVSHVGNGTNSSGFSGLPGGFRSGYGYFSDVGNQGNWWSAAEANGMVAWVRLRGLSNSSLYRGGRGNYGNYDGFSVRCVRD